METIKLNEKEYVSIEDYNKVKLDYDNLCLNQNKEKASIKDVGVCLMEESNVLGIGKVRLSGGEWIKTTISTEYLERILKGLKAMSFNKTGLESISICWTKNYPVIFGKMNIEKTEIAGFILAPRVDTD